MAGGEGLTMGARPMERVIQEHIKKPLADMVLFGSLAKGGTAAVTLNEAKDGLLIEALVEVEEPVEA